MLNKNPVGTLQKGSIINVCNEASQILLHKFLFLPKFNILLQLFLVTPCIWDAKMPVKIEWSGMGKTYHNIIWCLLLCFCRVVCVNIFPWALFTPVVNGSSCWGFLYASAKPLMPRLCKEPHLLRYLQLCWSLTKDLVSTEQRHVFHFNSDINNIASNWTQNYLSCHVVFPFTKSQISSVWRV